MPTDQMKTCSKCASTKSVEEFYRQKDAADGRKSWCKSCDNARDGAAKTSRAARNLVYNRALRILAERHRNEFDAIRAEIAASVEAQYAISQASSPHTVES